MKILVLALPLAFGMCQTKIVYSCPPPDPALLQPSPEPAQSTDPSLRGRYVLGARRSEDFKRETYRAEALAAHGIKWCGWKGLTP